MITLRAQKFSLTGIFAEQIFAIDWSKTYRFCGINFHDTGIYLKFCEISPRGLCLERSQNKAAGGKIYKKWMIIAFELLI